jgi:predicted ATPase
MFESIEFKNFKVLRDARLPLRPFTLILGPNGSGKTTALQALMALDINRFNFSDVATIGASGVKNVSLTAQWSAPFDEFVTVMDWAKNGSKSLNVLNAKTRAVASNEIATELHGILASIRVYAFDNDAIILPVMLGPEAKLGPKGSNLAVVLDRLRDQWPERFEAINNELRRWLPEFDTILFETPGDGERSIELRMKRSGAAIQAKDLSQGTIQALAILTVAYLPNPPRVIGIEEPDRGIHPRLLRQVRDALYRLSYPDQFGESRVPTQVIATTHSPYFLDLYRDRPEEVVLAEKLEDGARFTALSSHEHLEEILRDTQLGEAWYTGILGGVPTNT